MHTIQRRGLIAQVTAQLRGAITSGAWPVGSRIPTEPELAEFTGAGRNTVREAVQALAHAGLLERRQGSGTYVLSKSPVTTVLRREIDPARRREVLELRLALEVTAATLAASRRTEGDLAAMRAHLAEADRHHDADDVAAAARADMAFHRTLVAAAHNPTYLAVYDGIVPSVDLGTAVELEIEDAGSVFPHEHAELVDAIADGDAMLAGTLTHTFFASLLGRHGVTDTGGDGDPGDGDPGAEPRE